MSTIYEPFILKLDYYTTTTIYYTYISIDD